MLRRSNSNSHIPLPKVEMGRRSKSSVRLSGKTRPGSMDRLNVPKSSGVKRSVGTTPVLPSTYKKSSLGKYTTPSQSSTKGTVKKSGLATPLVASALFKRSTSNLTPVSYRSRSKSPFKIGSEKEKDWMNEQLNKVRNYLMNHRSCPEEIVYGFKPPITIETFVFVINLLFKEINPAVTVQTSNYKVVVVNMLKMIHYPGNIKNSLLQTVNTKHAWRDVIAIFSWLVDLINVINSVPVEVTESDDLKRMKTECIMDFITKRYLSYNGTGNLEEIDREFGETFGRILKVDENELKELETRVAKLNKGRDEQTKRLEDKQRRNEDLQTEIEKMQNEMDTYYANRKEKEDDVKYTIKALKERRERLKVAIQNKKDRVAGLTATLDKQPYTIKDKKRIVQHIDELQHTIALKKEANQEKKALKDASDFKLFEAKKELQTEVYRFNNRVMKLSSMEPTLKVLYLKEQDFLSKEFQNDIEELAKNYNIFKNKFSCEISEINSAISNMKTTITTMKKQKKIVQETVTKLKESINTVEKKIEQVDKEVEMLNDQRQENRNIFLQKVAEMKQTEATLEVNKQKVNELTVVYNKNANDLEIKKQKALEFFRSLHNIIVGNLEEMNNIRTDIFDMLKDCLTKVAETEGEILNDLHHLDDVRES